MDIQEIIRETVKETIKELRRENWLKEDAYDEAKNLIIDFYNGERPEVGDAIKSLSKDRFFKILPCTFRDGMTQEQLAVAYDCETSTITRNKKRLCLEVLRRVK